MADNHVITNHFNTVSPAVWVSGNNTGSTYGKPRRIDEDTLVALYSMASSKASRVNLRRAALAARGERENRKNPTERSGANTSSARCPHKKMNRKDQITAIVAGRIAKSAFYFGGYPLVENMHRRRELRQKNEKEFIKNQKMFARWLDSEYDRKGKEPVDGLVGLMDGFGLAGSAGEKVQDKMEIDVSGLEKKMARLDVIQEDDEEIM
ncbi:unnamed protein product [Tuber aestivum]|uniref:Uncharacterized protein n=1 Tax=Tuber aestivum TaxID=59557 RepID=A0A292Q9A7_9PEZI|nr:unnamed protein product [Tuber aestivum]